jgi:hypothetical protein
MVIIGNILLITILRAIGKLLGSTAYSKTDILQKAGLTGCKHFLYELLKTALLAAVGTAGLRLR